MQRKQCYKFLKMQQLSEVLLLN